MTTDTLPDAGARLWRLGERIFVNDRHPLEMPRERSRRREPGHAASGDERRLADLRHPPQPLREKIRLPAKGVLRTRRRDGNLPASGLQDLVRLSIMAQGFELTGGEAQSLAKIWEDA
jgi:hypothetical protein